MNDAQRILAAQAVILLAGKCAERRALRGSSAGWRRFRTPEEMVALHEAGHAALANAAGFIVFSASILHSSETAGVTGSGPSIGRVHFGLGVAPGLGDKPEGGPDIRQALRLCAIVTGNRGWRPILQLARYLHATASEQVERHWDDICRVAAVLIERRELSQADLAELLRRPVNPLAERDGSDLAA